jgi:hypothetical protein
MSWFLLAVGIGCFACACAFWFDPSLVPQTGGILRRHVRLKQILSSATFVLFAGVIWYMAYSYADGGFHATSWWEWLITLTFGCGVLVFTLFSLLFAVGSFITSRQRRGRESSGASMR